MTALLVIVNEKSEFHGIGLTIQVNKRLHSETEGEAVEDW
jgi:hypothetical protein